MVILGSIVAYVFVVLATCRLLGNAGRLDGSARQAPLLRVVPVDPRPTRHDRHPT